MLKPIQRHDGESSGTAIVHLVRRGLRGQWICSSTVLSSLLASNPAAVWVNVVGYFSLSLNRRDHSWRA